MRKSVALKPRSHCLRNAERVLMRDIIGDPPDLPPSDFKYRFVAEQYSSRSILRMRKETRGNAQVQFYLPPVGGSSRKSENSRPVAVEAFFNEQRAGNFRSRS